MKKLQPDDLSLLHLRGAGGYADLLLAYKEGGKDSMDAVASLLGYAPTPRKEAGTSGAARVEVPAGVVKIEERPELEVQPVADVPFWLLDQREFRRPVARPHSPTRPRAVHDTVPDSLPPVAELSGWRALLPRLRVGFAEQSRGRELDVPVMIRTLAKGRLLQRLPRLPRRRWGVGVQIIVDRSERMVPFQHDQDRVANQLASLFPRHAIEFALVLDGLDEPIVFGPRGTVHGYRIPASGTLVVVLGDLGCLASRPHLIAKRWEALGRCLVQAGCRPAALTPAPASRWLPGRLRPWTMLAWERRGETGHLTPAQLKDRAQRLLRLLSPAIRIEPGLLRDIRLLLREAADAGTEADVWQHGAMIGRSRVAGTLDAAAALRLRKEFAALEPSDMKNAVIQRLQQWRAGVRKEVWFEELLSLDPDTQAHLPDRIRDNDLPAVREHLRDLAPELASRHGGPAWYRRLYGRVPDTYHAQDDPEITKAQHQMFHAAFRDVAEPPPPPPGYDPASIEPLDADPVAVDLRQNGSRLIAAHVVGTSSPNPGPGSLLCTVETRNREILVEPFDPFWASGVPSPWASDWGRDEHGLWVAFAIKCADGTRVSQRLRWIPPGRFLMGSPEDEPERWDEEGPRHAVTIAKGFWLFDTACTQALWQAVMGDNPSQFQSPDRPVENVSWNDVRSFLERLNARVPGLELRLLSEAEWEYACRVGTETPFSFGDTITPQKVNYDGNYPYAGGEKGLFRGETVAVASLPPNRWGLYEMHGNVWEWCADHWHGSYKGVPADGSAWIDKGAKAGAPRVVRGGSWLADARNVRSASRLRFEPGRRYGGLGFRCARVQDGAEPRDQGAEPGGAGRVGQAERPTGPDRPGGAVLRRLGADGRTTLPIPAAPAFVLATDCERLTFGQITRPEWARAIGRDRFGLWTEIEVTPERPTPADRPVRQRLRWIAPGRFLMGSPEDEPGRYDDEGPQHEVTISRGYWLFDTPCPQALWQAVMGDNPSRFKSPQRPVEQVSWDDVQEFLTRINERVSGLDLSLLSEAEWEYACRAGTTTALYTGAIEILGERNAPALDPIAWYGGNSGVGFELDNGWDSADWPEKQYDHKRAGTRLVGLKQPNAWGLSDMLGNVWEWCADHWHDGYDGAPADGFARLNATAEAGASRVFRGGSWGDFARRVRAASRYGNEPGSRHDDLGFRCARVQDGAEPLAGRAEPGGAGRVGQAERPTGPDRPGEAGAKQGGGRRRRPKKQAK